MPLVILALLQGISLLTIGLFLWPLDWLSAWSMPSWLGLLGVLALLSWCLGD